MYRLTKQAGFINIKIYDALPTYNDPVHIIPIQSKDEKIKDLILSSRTLVFRILKHIFYKLDIPKYIGYAYIVFAQKDMAKKKWKA